MHAARTSQPPPVLDVRGRRRRDLVLARAGGSQPASVARLRGIRRDDCEFSTPDGEALRDRLNNSLGF